MKSVWIPSASGMRLLAGRLRDLPATLDRLFRQRSLTHLAFAFDYRKTTIRSPGWLEKQ